ncbi:hypothetical protein ACX8XP_03410 [Calditrichota bacterium LG25]
MNIEEKSFTAKAFFLKIPQEWLKIARRFNGGMIVREGMQREPFQRFTTMNIEEKSFTAKAFFLKIPQE